MASSPTSIASSIKRLRQSTLSFSSGKKNKSAVLTMAGGESVSIFGEPEPTRFQLSDKINGSLCLNVTFVAALTIRYTDKDGRFLSQSAFIPRDSSLFEGSCEETETHFNISWSNETVVVGFHLDTFKTRFWSVASVDMTLRNLTSADSDVFQLATKKGERHFATPINQSYSCHEREEIDLRDPNVDTSSRTPVVVMEMWDVEIHPLILTRSSKPIAFHCQEDGEMRAREENRASLIVAICLASFIVLILLVYGIVTGSRRIPYSNI